MKRNIYLEDIPLSEAQKILQEALEKIGCWQALPLETISIAQANGRFTGKAIWAKVSAPHYHASAMDGYALRAKDSEGATETKPIRFSLVDSPEEVERVNRPAQPINTGHPMPSWANAVVMIEHTQPWQAGNKRGIEIRAALPPWNHVRALGEDMVATELVLPANHQIRPVDLGALAGSGHAQVPVYRRAKVAIIPTGSELVSVETAVSDGISPGQIIEYNSMVLAAQVTNWGAVPTRWPVIKDEIEAIKTAVQEAAKAHDLILLNAGSSAGSEDYTAHVVDALGTLLVHGVAVRPGHPVVLGMIEPQGAADKTTPVPIIGVPGYPVSAALTAEIFVEPILAKWQGRAPDEPETITAVVTKKLNSHTGDDDFVRVTVGQVNEQTTATPISRGAGVITSLVRADGIVRIPRFSEGVEAGETVTVHLYRSRREIENSIVAIGSHDLTLDLLAQFLAEYNNGQRLSSANVGSLGGLVALRRGEAHFGGSHLLDPATGTYNESYIRRYLPHQDIVLVTLVGREQGWIVPLGNPLNFQNWRDAARPDVQIINRQRGAGTRVLLDYELEKHDISATQVRGYEREEYTHLAVAAAVSSGIANAGIGIRAAARALNLDFIPLTHERYDLVMTKAVYESELMQPLLALLHDNTFKTAVSHLPGYDITPMGNIQLLENR
ncbi:MAG: molybdopterin biosynthesis protein [Chloroflexi bacterium]|nr:MAG: molybdopterin biosynthesis protein [Chloroflexota bacterium]PIE81158.1 MAG: molybdopterin biosynthesis protein [Chloroflexota bacterium]